MSPERAKLATEIGALIDRLAGGARDDAARDDLLRRLAAHQRASCPPFARLCAARSARFDRDLDDWPAMPTDVFRYARVSSFDDPRAAIRIFRTSGTTSGARGEHSFVELGLYDRAARAAASFALFQHAAGHAPAPDRVHIPGAPPPGPEEIVILAPPPERAPDSSLSYMLGRFTEWWPARRTTWCWTEQGLDLDQAAHALETTSGVTAVLGTSFAFVHLEDALGSRAPFSLAPRSFVMQTGGYKGRSREVAAEALRAMIARRFTLAEHRVVSEYGMTELSSQMYGRGLIEGSIRSEGERLWVPGWVRVVAVDPDRLRPLGAGERGLLRIDDLANLDSVCSIQTSDLGRVYADGSIGLEGRAPGAVPRGCSLAIEEAMERRDER